MNIVGVLLVAAKASYEAGDMEQHKIACDAVGALVKHWERQAQHNARTKPHGKSP